MWWSGGSSFSSSLFFIGFPTKIIQLFYSCLGVGLHTTQNDTADSENIRERGVKNGGVMYDAVGHNPDECGIWINSATGGSPIAKGFTW